MAPSARAKEEMDRDFSDFQSPHEASLDRLIKAVDRAYHRPFLLMWRSFLSGMMAAIGAAVGTALIVILSGYLFQVLGGAALLQNFVQDFKDEVVGSPGGVLLPRDN